MVSKREVLPPTTP